MSTATASPTAPGLLWLVLVGVTGVVVVLLAGVALAWRRAYGRPGPGSVETLGDALAGFADGLDGPGVERAVRRLRSCLGVEALTLFGRDGVIATDALDAAAERALRAAVAGGPAPTATAATGLDLVVARIVLEGHTVAEIAVMSGAADRRLDRAVEAVAGLIGAQLAVGRLAAARQGRTEAQLLALKAQIRPHFVYNALNVISSFTITDPERARSLLGEFADFTRYSFRELGPFTVLADELRAIDSYLLLERARFGDRLKVRLRISPESLTTRLPHLCLQPLVENAVRHGIESSEGEGTIVITSRDEGALTIVTIEDDGVGMDPDRLRAVLAGELEGVHVGLRNVDLRLRQIYGRGFGLVIDTAVGAGTMITIRIPKSTGASPS